MSTPTRPVARYHGGKWRNAPRILALLPAHRVYVEPFGGAASVLLRKPRSYAEVYNDMDAEMVNLFRVLRDPATASRLREAVCLTPYARQEFEAAYEPPTGDAVEDARRTLVRSFMGFGSAGITREHVTGFRGNVTRSGTTPATDWAGWPAQIPAFVERMRAVVIEHAPAAEVITRYDGDATLFYVDPPYPHGTRSLTRPRGGRRACYRYEFTDDDHRALAAQLRAVRGMVALSGYACAMYDAELYPDWERHEWATVADSAKPRTEVLWLNPACAAARALPLGGAA